jgi:hypothetical protein
MDKRSVDDAACDSTKRLEEQVDEILREASSGSGKYTAWAVLMGLLASRERASAAIANSVTSAKIQ